MQSLDKCTWRLHSARLITHVFIESEPSEFQHNNFFKNFCEPTRSPDASKPRSRFPHPTFYPRSGVDASPSCFLPLWRRGREGARSPAGGIGESVWLLPPLVSSGGPSVPQDDLDKARHVRFFGVVGGEERMLLRGRRIGQKSSPNILVGLRNPCSCFINI